MQLSGDLQGTALKEKVLKYLKDMRVVNPQGYLNRARCRLISMKLQSGPKKCIHSLLINIV